MFNQFLGTSFKSFSLYIANDNQELRQVSVGFVEEFVQKFELNFKFFTFGIVGSLVVNQDLIRNSIGKDSDHLTAKNVIRVVFEDSYGFILDKTFVCTGTEMAKFQNDKSGEMVKLNLLDIYSYYLNQKTPDLQVKSYKGSPLSVVEQLLTDSIKTPDEILRSYNLKTLDLYIENNTFSFLEDNDSLTWKHTQNRSALDDLDLLCSKYNITLFQDFKGIRVIENFNFHDLEEHRNEDDSELWCDKVPDRYPYNIFDKKKQFKSYNINSIPRLKVSLNTQGKTQTLEDLDFNEILDIIDLNNNSREFANTFDTREVTESSGTNGKKALVYDYSRLFIRYSNLAIYVSGPLEECNPGTKTSVRLNLPFRYIEEAQRGDERFSGNWFIGSSSFALVNRHMFIRLGLCRFDSPKIDTVSEVISEEGDNYSYSSKPPLPKKERTFVTEVSSALDEIQSSIRDTEQFAKKMVDMSAQINKLKQFSDQSISALTAPIKKFTNSVNQSSLSQTYDSILRNNRRTLTLASEILAKNSKDFRSMSIINSLNNAKEVLNPESFVKDTVLNQVTGTVDFLTSRAKSTVTNISNAVYNTIENGQVIIEQLDSKSTNKDDAVINLDSGIEKIEKVLKAVQSTKDQVDTVVTTLNRVEKDLKNIPNSIPIENPLEVLKQKRKQLLRSVGKY